MADALVSFVLEQLVSIIIQEVQQEVRLVVGVQKEVKKLSSTLKIIQAVLDDAEKKQVNNEQLKLWLQKLKDAAYDVDDILDDWHTQILKSQIQAVDNPRVPKKKVCSYLFCPPCSCFNQVALRHDISHRIKEMKENLDEIANEKDKYKLIESRTTVEEPKRYKTSSVINVSEVCGRTQDKDIIVSKLLSESSQQELGIPVISIVGMGGLGKTTLAQLVFHDEKVNNHFDKTMWVCVSEPFDLIVVAKSIIEEAGDNVPNVVGWEALHQHLCNSVKGKRFLLVLDDVWTEDPKDWNPLKLSLDGGAQGSRIVVTTRNERVATMMRSTYTHSLGKLSEKDCWLLFSRFAFFERDKEERERLEKIGEEISKKCKGMPLAVKTIASLMPFKKNRQDWQDVFESETWELRLPGVEEGVFLFPALLLSYYALPLPLKRCFTYCAVFPKDYEMEKDTLIKLWMAQGFVSTKGTRDLEKIGAEHFDDLVARSFFQDLRKDKHNQTIGCKMHDIVHDCAQFLTNNECFIMGSHNTEFGDSKVRHLKLLRTVDIESIIPSIYKAKNLRTLQLSSVVADLPDLLHHFTCLRTLDLSHTKLEELPSEVEKLIHLRYLDLTKTKLEELPEMLSNLYNLQTLKLTKCDEFYKLPEGVGKLINLRHLEIEWTNRLSYLPQGIGRLTSLRTLCKFIVNEECKIGELKYLNLLQGKLEIRGLRRVANVNEAELKNKQLLRALCLHFEQYDWENVEEGEVERMESMLEGLQLPANLEKLEIKQYPGTKFPSWIGGSILSNLLTLKLIECRKCIQMLDLGKLPFLEKLIIENMDEVTHIGQEFHGIGGRGGGDGVERAFPKLKELNINGMNTLEELDLRVEDGEIMPRLRNLSIEDCPELKVLPAVGILPMLEILDISEMESVKRVGLEFLGISDNDDGTKRDGGVSVVTKVFPKLKKLTFYDMEEWEEWELPIVEDRVIMPCLRELTIDKCTKLRALPALGKLESLEILKINRMNMVKRIGLDLLGLSKEDVGTKGNGEASKIVIFPKLKELSIVLMDELEKWEMTTRREDEVRIAEGGEDVISIMPCLHSLTLTSCPKLKVLPHPIFFLETLRELHISNCPKLTWTVSFLPPLLEKLIFYGDAGDLSRSLPIGNNNIKSLIINASPLSSLPQGIEQLKALQRLEIISCTTLMFMAKGLRHLTKLRELYIFNCPTLALRCQKNVGEDWSIISQVRNIWIDDKKIH